MPEDDILCAWLEMVLNDQSQTLVSDTGRENVIVPEDDGLCARPETVLNQRQTLSDTGTENRALIQKEESKSETQENQLELKPTMKRRVGRPLGKRSSKPEISCAVCGETVRSERAQLHVKTKHFQLPLYTCNLCNYSGKYNSHAKAHNKKLHQDEAEIITDNVNMIEFLSVQQACFPRRKNAQLLELVESSSVTPESVPTLTKEAKVYTLSRDCVLCGEAVKVSRLQLHVKTKHVSLPLYRCSVCDYAGKYTTYMQHHVNKMHGGAAGIVPEKNNKKMLIAVQLECFPLMRMRESHMNALNDGGSLEGVIRKVKVKSVTQTGHTCMTCGETVPVAHLQTHVITAHFDWPLFQCSECDLQKMHSHHLKLHIKSEHSNKGHVVPLDDNRHLLRLKQRQCFPLMRSSNSREGSVAPEQQDGDGDSQNGEQSTSAGGLTLGALLNNSYLTETNFLDCDDN